MQKIRPHFADPKGILMQGAPGYDDGILAEGSTVPANGTAGYEEGCLFFVRGSTAGSGLQLYVNEGTSSSCQFNPLFTDTTRRAINLVAIPAATTTLTLVPGTHAGKIITVGSTGGLAITPPAATGTGNVYEFVFRATVSGGSFTFDAKAGNASDILSGRAYQLKVGTGEVVYAAGATDNLLTLNGTTTGGLKGDCVTLVDIATNLWYVIVDSTASGTVATPFSNH